MVLHSISELISLTSSICFSLHVVCVLHALHMVRSGQGKLEKSGKVKSFPVTRKSGNMDYSPIVRESPGI